LPLTTIGLARPHFQFIFADNAAVRQQTSRSFAIAAGSRLSHLQCRRRTGALPGMRHIAVPTLFYLAVESFPVAIGRQFGVLQLAET